MTPAMSTAWFFFGVASIRVIGHTHAAQVGDDHGMVFGQNNCQGGPHITRKAEAMQQHQAGTLAADSDVEAGAVWLEPFACESWPETA